MTGWSARKSRRASSSPHERHQVCWARRYDGFINGRMVPVTQRQPRLASRPQHRRRTLARLAWALALVVGFVLLLPYLLTPLYRVIDPVSTLMLWRWANGARVERQFVSIDRMAPALPTTVIASEDGRFCWHRGIDWRELRGRLHEVDEISEARGVSTITQQTAKNLFLWPGRSFVRKALEVPLSLWINLVLPKRRVLEIYLNIAEWGPSGQFGAEAASRSADALAQPTYVEDKDSGELRRPHHIDLKTGMYRGRQVLKVRKEEA